MSYGTFAACPQCKRREGIHVSEWYTADGGSTYYCVCDNCGYEDPDKFEEEHVAIDHWNRRVCKGYVHGADSTRTEFDNLLTHETDHFAEESDFDDYDEYDDYDEDDEEAGAAMLAAAFGMHVVSVPAPR